MTSTRSNALTESVRTIVPRKAHPADAALGAAISLWVIEAKAIREDWDGSTEAEFSLSSRPQRKRTNTVIINNVRDRLLIVMTAASEADAGRRCVGKAQRGRPKRFRGEPGGRSLIFAS